MEDEIKRLIEGKDVFIAAHWDADGITSGAMLYHTLKDCARSIKIISKGDVFMIGPDDVDPGADVVITADIKPSPELTQDVIYIDHHPWDDGKSERDKHNFLLEVFDENYQSCSLLVYDKILKEKDNPYFVFLALLGYFGDGGCNNNVPPKLELKAMELFPDLMQRKNSFYSENTYLEIERYVSSLNTGKRLHWSGQVPMNLFTAIERYEPFVENTHPLAQELQQYKKILRNYYDMPVKFEDLGHLKFAVIDCPANVQGVICARHMKTKPVLVINKYNGNAIASMRVPDSLSFDAGAYLASFKEKIDGLIGGGHEKAGGLSFPEHLLPEFLSLLKQRDVVCQE